MIVREQKKRPEPLRVQCDRIRYRWAIPLVAFEWIWQWVAYLLSSWSFLEVLEYLGRFSVLIAVIFYFSESGNRIKQKHYQAWQVINTSQGKGGSGGRIDALRELNADGVPLIGVDVSTAYLQGVDLSRAALTRANFNAVDARNSNFRSADLTGADLRSANLRESNLQNARLIDADLTDADLNSAKLAGSDLSRATLDNADLRDTDLHNIHWQEIRSIKMANITGVKDAPDGFTAWALKHGAIQDASPATP
jgi:Pentapeptide repeats (8 copies)